MTNDQVPMTNEWSSPLTSAQPASSRACNLAGPQSPVWALVIGTCSFIGHWSLVIGHSLVLGPSPPSLLPEGCTKTSRPLASARSTKPMNALPCRVSWITAAVLFATGLASFATDSSQPLLLATRSLIKTAEGSNEWQRVEKTVEWSPKKTAIVICDMWDKHWCQGATRRVAEMASRMHAVVQKARSQGVFIIHCPSDTMKFYEGTPGRKLAQAAPPATPKVPLQRWCSLDQTR